MLCVPYVPAVGLHKGRKKMSDEALLVLDDYLEECYMQGDSTMKKDQKDALIVAMRCLCPTSRFARRQREDERGS